MEVTVDAAYRTVVAPAHVQCAISEDGRTFAIPSAEQPKEISVLRRDHTGTEPALALVARVTGHQRSVSAMCFTTVGGVVKVGDQGTRRYAALCGAMRSALSPLV